MLEVAILDGVERIAASVNPTISSSDLFSMPVVGDATVSGTAAQFCNLYVGASFSTSTSVAAPAAAYMPGVPVWLPANALWMLDNHGAAAGYLAMSFSPVAETLVLEDAVRGLSSFSEDKSGVIWAVGLKSGYYGLWKRTGAGQWTQVLSDTASGNLAKWTTGDPYYKSGSGNWYVLSAGSATLTTDPGAVSYPGWIGLASSSSLQAVQRLCGFDMAGNPVTHSNPLIKSAPAFQDNFSCYTWPGKSFVCARNKALSLYDIRTAATDSGYMFIPVGNSSYWIEIHFPITAANGVFRANVAIYNVSTGQSQLLGQVAVNVPYWNATSQGFSASVIPVGMNPFAAYLDPVTGAIRLYFVGQLGATSPSTQGIARADVYATLSV